VLHNDLEALFAALMVATGAAAQGMDVTIFFTFWGLNLLRGDHPNPAFEKEPRTWAQWFFQWIMPRGPRRQALGKHNYGGLGAGMLQSIMKQRKVMDLPELIEAAVRQDVRFVACSMSMGVMGISKRDLHPYANLEFGGVAAYVGDASSAELSLVF
jgi:peroxiredoxin family protein